MNKLDFKNERFQGHSVRKSCDDEKRIVTCIAMAAYEIDAHGDMFLPSAVEKMSHAFLAGYNVTSSLDKQHSVDVDADLVGSFYVVKSTNVDGLDVPDFSWVAQWHINDDATWDQVQQSELTGFSIFGEASGWKVNEATETQLADHLAKAKVGDSQYTKPLRVFDDGTASKLSIVDAGANLHFAIYKRKDQMADTRETVTTEAVQKAQVPAAQPEAQASETPATHSEAQVEKSTAPAQDPVQALIEKMTIAQGLDLVGLRKAYDQIGAALHIGGATPQPAPTPAPVTTPAPAQVDQASMIKAAVNEATAELRKELEVERAKIEELRKAKVASSGTPDPETEDPTKIQKSKNPKDVFGGSFTGFFS